MAEFVHLHNHTDFSLLDGAAPVEPLVKRAAELGMKHLAVTDHGSMFGTLRFYTACRDAGINPIIGCEFYVAPNSRLIKTGSETGNNYYHMVLLAMNQQGYKNLMLLDSKAYIEGFYYKPRIDDQLLEEHHEGLICLSACLAGEISSLLLNEQYDRAKERAQYYSNLFGNENYYLELQDHGIADQNRVNTRLVQLSQETGIPLVATNDIHYINQDDANAQDILICIGTNRKKHETGRMRFESDQFYLKSAEQMEQLFSFAPEAVENTVKIAQRCNLEIEFPGPLLPEFKIPEGFDSPDDYLRHITQQGLIDRYTEVTEDIQKRADYELGVITGMDFTGYFLIVWDFIHWAKKHNIPVGPGRGSGAGSIVAYAMTITDIDPLKYNLLFERFLNPERVSMPDFDIDFCFERRQEVIDYVNQKYGSDRVAQIITFGTLKAKAVIKDVSRVLDIPFSETNEISKLIPADPKMTLEKAMEQEPKLKELEAKGGIYAELFDVGRRLEGLNRHCSTHAAGIVIGHDELTEYVPLYRDAKTGAISTQYTMDLLEECGLVKMDFLGLKTLTLIQNTVDLINKDGGDFDINTIPEDDERTFRMLSEGASSCIFQFESQGMQGILREAKPNSIEDLIALNALYRPGPMANIPKFIASKNGKEPIVYYHKDLEQALKQTYGVIVYQEQVMQVAQIIGGFSLGKADIMRRAMGKKKVKVMAEMKQEFMDGASKKGYTKEFAKNIFEMLEPFAGYGFNKSHAAAYSVIAYQTAYLKANYPVQFMAANLTNEINNTDKLTQYITETKSMGIDILPPNINLSELRFNAVDGKVVYGLNGIKNVGAGAVNLIIEERENNGPFSSFMDFLNRVDSKVLNRKLLESLIQAGAFDQLDENRSTLMLNLEDVVDYVAKRRAAEQYGQSSLFDIQEEESLGNFKMTPAEDLSLAEKLQLEKELLGFYFSGHPMDEYREIWNKSIIVDLSNTDHLIDKHACSLLGMVSAIRSIVTKRGEPMAFGQIEDFKGSIELIFFPKVWQQYRHLVEIDRILGFTGKIDKQRGEAKFLVDTVVEPEELKQDGVSQIHINLNRELCRTDELNKLRGVCLDHPGPCWLYLHLPGNGDNSETIIKSSGQLRVTYSDALIDIFKENPIVTDVWYL
jgi:DNA polymerase-3 subunit alpha